ncbi:hypothetical protein [Lysinibacillus sp. 3P01SB]
MIKQKIGKHNLHFFSVLLGDDKPLLKGAMNEQTMTSKCYSLQSICKTSL